MLKKLYYLLAIFLTILAPVAAGAEGSKNLTSNGLGYRPFLEDGSTIADGIPRRNTIQAYAVAGETIELGSSAIGTPTSGGANIVATAPDGTRYDCRTQGNNAVNYGRIVNRPQEENGTFTPCVVPVGTGQTGIWEIQFLAPASNYVPATGVISRKPNGNPNRKTVADPNPSLPDDFSVAATDTFIAAWDVTVKNGGAAQSGRVFANYLALNAGFDSGRMTKIYSIAYVQTKDGYLYKVDLNGMYPMGFIFFANKDGFTSGGQARYQSVEQSAIAGGIANPSDSGTDLVTHKMFFNLPNLNLPENSTSFSRGSTWLLNPPTPPPTPTNLIFIGKEGTPNRTGTNPLQGTFKFDAPGPDIPYSLAIDVDHDGNYNGSIDRVFFGRTVAGTNEVIWDGKDGLGNNVPPSLPPNETGYNATVKLFSGEVHFPFIDVERNVNGIKIIRETPRRPLPPGFTLSDENKSLVYYDDSGFPAGQPGQPTSLRALGGVSSTNGAHAFGNGADWGDLRGIDTWVLIPSVPLSLANRIKVLQADLNITKQLVNSNQIANGQINYIINVTNNGPSNVTGVGVTDIFPTVITSPTWTCAITTGTGACPANGSGDINTTVDLNAGAVATFTVTGTIDPNAPRPITNSATVTRPNDVADPVDQDGSGGDNTTETTTSSYSGLGIAKQAGTVTANSDGSFSIPYTLVITNTTSVPFSNLQVTEDLKATFGNSPFTIGSLTASAGLTVNSSFNGDSNKNLLIGNDTLPAPVAPATSVTGTIEFTVRVTPTSSAPPYQNTARVSGALPGGVVVTDDSTDGSNPDSDDDGNSANDGNGDPSDNNKPTIVNFDLPRLGVAKSVGTPIVVSLADGIYRIPYTVTVTNLGNVPITNLQVTDSLATTSGTLSFPLKSISSPTLTVNPNFNNNTNQNLLAGTDTLAVGQTAQINFTVEIDLASNAGSVSNTATGFGTGGSPAVSVSDVSTNGTNSDPDGDGNPKNNSDPTVVSITQNPVLGVAKSAGLPINNNDGSYTIPYTLTLANLGNVAISNLQVTDNLSATFTNASGTVPFSIESGSISSTNDWAVNINFNGSTNQSLLTGTNNSLAIGATAQISFNVRITPGKNNGQFSNTATANGSTSAGLVSDNSTNGGNPDPDGNGNPSENQATVVNIPRLGVAKAAGTPVNNNNGTYTIPYTLVVKNMGNVAINNLQVSDDLSTTFANALNFSIQSISSRSLAVNSGYTGRSPNQNLLLGTNTLAVGATVDATAEIKFNVVITPGSNFGPFENTATAKGNTSAGPVDDDSTNGADPDPDNNGNPRDNSLATSVQIQGIPNLRLVKRVTRINQTPLANVVDDLNDPNDNASSWPGNYLQGQINVPDILPGDEVEYTIYFLSDGGVPANDVRICDRIPENQTFVSDGFTAVSGSAVQFGTSAVQNLTNADDTDSGTFVPVGTTIDINLCSGSNTNGALIWNLGNIPSNTNPINYGFVRFRSRVK